jgi:hypothetical protein
LTQVGGTGGASETGGSASTTTAIPVVTELQARAEAIFGRAPEIVRLDSDKPLGYFLDQFRDPAAPCPDPEIAVECGGGLCAIVMNGADEKFVRELVAANSWSLDSGTVWAAWRGAYLIFARVTGESPPNCSFPGGQWISDGLVPFVDLTAETTSQSFPLKGTCVFSLPFDAIGWPAPVAELFRLKRIESEHGQLFQTDGQKQIILGHETAAQFFAELLGLKYSRRDDTFTTTAGGKTELIPKSNLQKIIFDWLRQQTAAAGIKCPSDDVLVARVVERLKKVCAVEQLDESEGLAIFLTDRLELKAGASVSSAELFSSYREFCQARGAVCFAERAFHKRATIAIREQLGICKNHCVPRQNPDGSTALKYGFRNLALKGARGSTGAKGD